MKEAVAWHALIPRPITGPEEALAFVNELGFCTRGPVPRLSFSYLALRHGGRRRRLSWTAPGGWKDDLHIEVRSQLADDETAMAWHLGSACSLQ